jgi:hypothetical protein
LTAPATRTVFLHIGLHKTGTTYLQSLLRANQRGLADQDIFWPGADGQPPQVFAAWDLLGRRPRGARDARITGAWQSTVDLVNATPHPTTLISDEHLSLATARQARKAVEAFDSAQVHVIATARDLARILVSAWQEEVKNQGAWSWSEFVTAVKDPEAVGRSPARGFWLRQDLPAILNIWAAAVPAERIHVVTVPPPGAAPEVLLARFAAVVGFDPARLTAEPPWANETVGLAGTEVIRRLNELLAGKLNQRQYERAMKLTVARILAERSDPVRFTLPAEEFEWASSRAREMVEAISARGYPVVGDIADLVPAPSRGRRPDDTSDREVLDAALVALAGLMERYAKVWWARKSPDEEVEIDSWSAKAASTARVAGFRARRSAARLADRTPVAGKALGLYLRSRAGLRRS